MEATRKKSMDELDFLTMVTAVHGPLRERLVEATRLAKLLQEGDLGGKPRAITLLRAAWKGRDSLREIRRLLTFYSKEIDDLPLLTCRAT